MQRNKLCSILGHVHNAEPFEPIIARLSLFLIANLDILSNDDLKTCVLSLISIDDWGDECEQCCLPQLLHEGPCTRKEEVHPKEGLQI